MASITMYSDFRAQENKICHASAFSSSVCHEELEPDIMIFICFFKNWFSSQLFYSPLSTSSKGSLVPLYFLPLEWYHLHIMILFHIEMIPAMGPITITWVWFLPYDFHLQQFNKMSKLERQNGQRLWAGKLKRGITNA